MEINNNTRYNQRDFKTLKRIETAQKTSIVLAGFFDKGFKSFDALRAIVQNYHPEIEENRLWNFWHFRQIDEVMCENLEDVFEKLNKE